MPIMPDDVMVLTGSTDLERFQEFLKTYHVPASITAAEPWVLRHVPSAATSLEFGYRFMTCFDGDGRFLATIETLYGGGFFVVDADGNARETH